VVRGTYAKSKPDNAVNVLELFFSIDVHRAEFEHGKNMFSHPYSWLNEKNRARRIEFVTVATVLGLKTACLRGSFELIVERLL